MKINHRTVCRILSSLVMVLATMVFVAAYAAEPTATENRGSLSASDYKFAKAAAEGGMMEVSLGRIAGANSGNTAVQQFGQHMVTDHGKAGQDLAQIASQKGATLPTQPTARQQREIERLTKLTGVEFDRAYASAMVRDHKADVKEFQKAVAELQDQDLKAFAANTLTIVQDHLKMAENLDESLKPGLSMNP